MQSLHLSDGFRDKKEKELLILYPDTITVYVFYDTFFKERIAQNE